ncbi:MAG TPA: dihydroorotase [Flavobacteriaceae bacterium]|nr:dihydroorotase [Flavobacteriaceae bacterium]
MKKLLIKNAKIVNEGKVFEGEVYVEGDTIVEVANMISAKSQDVKIIDAEGKYLLPGVIDDHVHFREPGLTYKEDIYHGSRAAIAGGITSFMEMPNTSPSATSLELLEEKFDLAAESSLANYSFIFGATNDNLEEIKKLDPKKIPGVKLFLGCSTGNLYVSDQEKLKAIFEQSPVLLMTHCEDQDIMDENLQKYIDEFGDDIPIKYHPKIRSEEACFVSTSKTVDLAKKTGARLHVMHISTAKEVDLFSSKKPLEKRKITGEVCVHHLWFNDKDYEKKGTLIKWNPSIKTEKDQQGLLKGLLDDKLEIIGTDHAPHTKEEKDQVYTKAPSGGPLVQHSLPAMLELHHQEKISLEKIVEKMCHNPATLFRIRNRGFIREGYKADLCLVDLNAPWTVQDDNIFYKCEWSPFKGTTFKSRVTHTFVNGQLVYNNFKFPENTERNVERLTFDY